MHSWEVVFSAWYLQNHTQAFSQHCRKFNHHRLQVCARSISEHLVWTKDLRYSTCNHNVLFLGIPLSLSLSHSISTSVLSLIIKKRIIIVNKIVQNTQKETDCWLCSFASCLSIYFQIQTVVFLLMELNWKQQFQSKHDSGWNSYKATHNKELAGDL